MDKRLMSMDEDSDNPENEKGDDWIDELESDKALREKLRKKILGSGGKKMIKQDCLQCGAEEQAYEARQLRSVDEGQTIFYECLQCGNKTVLHS